MQGGKRKLGKREMAKGSEWKHLLFGTAVSVLTAVAFLGLCAVLMGSGMIPEQAGEGCVLLACAAGALLGGRTAVRGRKGTLVWGLAVGVLTVAVLGVSGFLLYDGLEMRRCAAVGGACLCGGGLAGALGGGGKKRRG